MSAIVAEGIVRTFGGLTAVDDVSLTVGPGEVVGLVGANGAGKTTLIRVILGLLAPDRGAVRLAGGPPTRESRRRVGYLPQGMGLWTDLTLAEHLELVRDAYGMAHAPALPADLATGGRTVGDLPLGLRRRAAFAVALAHDPDVLILDEPTSGVDPLARSRLWDTIRAAADAGAGVLVSTHYLEEAARCDRIVLLASGRVVADGTLEALTAGRTALQISAPRWQEAWERLEQAGVGVLPAGRDLRVADASDEDVRAIVAGLDATVTVVPATLDEVFQQVAR